MEPLVIRQLSHGWSVEGLGCWEELGVGETSLVGFQDEASLKHRFRERKEQGQVRRFGLRI